jgi:Uma2 family endonuclease
MGTRRAIQRLEAADDSPHEDHFVVIHDVTWKDYERLLAIRGERAVPRLTYLEGVLEIMSPARSHELIKSVIGCLVETWCLEHDVVFSPYGSWTLKKRKEERGAEADECYVFGDALEPERPDLAIEVLWTSGRIDKLEVYRKLGVREVWYWRKGRITPYVLRGERYRAATKSKFLPHLDLEELASFIDHAPPVSAAIRAYRDRLRKRAR